MSLNVSASSVASDGPPPTDTREPGFIGSTWRMTRTRSSSGATSSRVTTRLTATITTSALSQFSARLSARVGLPIDTRLESRLPPLTREEELVIYRVAQEALTNVVRHAGASRSELVLERGPDRLTLRVRDDGRGIDGAREASGGIRGMQERATLIHADLRIGRRPGGGTEVVLRVPLYDDGSWSR